MRLMRIAWYGGCSEAVGSCGHNCTPSTFVRDLKCDNGISVRRRPQTFWCIVNWLSLGPKLASHFGAPKGLRIYVLHLCSTHLTKATTVTSQKVRRLLKISNLAYSCRVKNFTNSIEYLSSKIFSRPNAHKRNFYCKNCNLLSYLAFSSIYDCFSFHERRIPTITIS